MQILSKTMLTAVLFILGAGQFGFAETMTTTATLPAAAPATMAIPATPATLPTAPTAKSEMNFEKPKSTTAKYTFIYATSRLDADGVTAANNNLYSFKNYTINSQVFAATYSTSPTLTFVAKTAYNNTFLETVTPAFGKAADSPDRTSGLTDTTLLAITPVYYNNGHLVTVEAGASLPTGSISETRPFSTRHYAYTLQLGSGTIDPVVGVNYSYKPGRMDYAAHAQMTDRLGYDNRFDYHLGNEYKTVLSSSYSLNRYFSPLLKFDYTNQQGMHGADPSLGYNPFTNIYYHPQIKWALLAGAQSTIPLTGSFKGAAVNLEGGIPLIQNMINTDDAKLKAHYYVTAGLRFAL